jgi:hypothetical protein
MQILLQCAYISKEYPMPAEFGSEDTHEPTPTPAVTNADRAGESLDERFAREDLEDRPTTLDAVLSGDTDADRAEHVRRDQEQYGDLTHLSPQQQQRVRDQIDGQAMMQAAADSNPGGIPGERYTVEKGGPQPLAPGAITGIPEDLKADSTDQ